MKPSVTVVIPTYNWATALRWALGSVLAQRRSDFEVLVVGDGCTDESEDVVRCAGDERVRWRNLPVNTGSQVVPNNTGIAEARGEVIAYLGHDDLWTPHHLEHVVAAVEAGAPFAFGTVLQLDPGRPPYVAPGDGYVYTPGDWLPPTSIAHRRSLVEAVGGWRDSAPGDLADPEADLWRRMAGAAGAPTHVPLVTAVKPPAGYRRDVYRRRPDDEQARWWAVIAGADDPDAVLRAACAGPVVPGEAVDAAVIGDRSVPAAERRRRRRVYKGLAADPS